MEDLAGNYADSDSVQLTIDTVQPNVPYLDVLSDTGDTRDDVTNIASLEVEITINDTPEGSRNPFPHDLMVRVYERTHGQDGEQLIYDSFVDLEGFTELGQIATVLPELADGLYNLKVEAEDRAGNLSSAFLIDVEIDTQNPSLGDPEIDLAEYADSGMSSSDHVTHIRRPAILGRATPGSAVIVYANGEIAGTGIVNSDDSDGKPGDGLGAWEITVEPLADDVYELVARVHDIAGNSVTTKPLTIEIDSLPPNLPFLDLAQDFDTGRHNDDNVTIKRT